MIMKKSKSALNKRYQSVFRFVVWSALSVMISSCYYDVIVSETLDDAEEISFSSDIMPVLKASCTSCHDGKIALPDLQQNQAYNALIDGNYLSYTDGEESSLISKIRSGHPYDGALTETEIQKLVLWMEAGAKNN